MLKYYYNKIKLSSKMTCKTGCRKKYSYHA